VVGAFEASYNNPRPGEVYNLGGGRSNAASLLELLDRFGQIVGRPVEHEYREQNRVGDHIVYMSYLRKFRSHYPDWELTRSLDDIVDDAHVEHLIVCGTTPLTLALCANLVRRRLERNFYSEASDPPLPTLTIVGDDAEVIGAPFYLMTFVEGTVYSDADAVEGLTEAQALAATDELIDVLAHLHGADYEAIGLGDLGRPEGFLERQIGRWKKQWEAAKQRAPPAIDEVARRLERSVPAQTGKGIVHGDYSFNNTMWSNEDPTRMVSVLDWEMSTLGDPLTDLGMVSVYWDRAGEIMWRSRSPQPHRMNPGFPGSDHLLARYEQTSGTSVHDIDVYRVLAVYKLAGIAEGALARIRATRPDDDTSATEATVQELAALALDLADQSSVPSLHGA